MTNGQVNTPEGTTYGSTGFVICDEGFTLFGESLVSCRDGPFWSYVPECIRGRLA